MAKHPSTLHNPPTAVTYGGAGTSPRLTAHLAAWLGSWPPATPMEVVGAPQRNQPGWDGAPHPVLEVFDPHTGTVLSVPPTTLSAVRDEATRAPAELWKRLPTLMGQPGRGSSRAVMRWTTHPSPLPEAGSWLAADARDVPTWLRPFGGHVLVATAPDGTHLAGVGIKRHTRYGHELAVGLPRRRQTPLRVPQAFCFPPSLCCRESVPRRPQHEERHMPEHRESAVPAVDRLTVYGTGWCPGVRRSRRLLDEAGIDYRYVDLDADRPAARLVRRLQHGARRIPTLVWPDGRWLTEPTDLQLAEHLGTAPTSSGSG